MRDVPFVGGWRAEAKRLLDLRWPVQRIADHVCKNQSTVRYALDINGSREQHRNRTRAFRRRLKEAASQ